jgi:phosphatidyl-myo-inositol alpha-mannosyltransferase
MRIGLVSPYSWTYPGGVTRHIEALAGELERSGHEVRVLAPVDPDDRLSARLHRGARPQRRELPDYVVPLGRTMGFPANGAVSNIAPFREGFVGLRSELSSGGYDVVHIHEPVAPILGWDALGVNLPLVGTFHCYSTNLLSNNVGNLCGAWLRLNRLRVRIAVSEAAAWTGRRFYGGRYRVIPNGVEVAHAPPARPLRPLDAPLRLAFVGQAVERKGLPVLLRAFEALREHVPVTLTVIGADAEEIAPLLLDDRGVRALGKVSDDEKHRELREADLLCAPSLGGESFGMVLTEAFAAGTPVVASDIAGYADVVTDGADGLLVPRGDPAALAAALRDLALDPQRRAAMGVQAARSAQRYAWPRVAAEVVAAYEEAIAMPAPEGAPARVASRLGMRPADGRPFVRPRRLPRLDPAPPASAPRGLAGLARRASLVVAAAGAILLTFLALQRIGVDQVVRSLLASSPGLVVAGLAVMCASMVLRGFAWHAILRAALPGTPVRRSDALQGTFIGVLMSATLPARLGEPSRALIVARRLGRAREHLPTVLGSIVSQTLLNLFALGVLGVVMFSTVDLFSRHTPLVLAAVAPLAVLVIVLLAPVVLGGGCTSRSARIAGVVDQLRRALVQVRRGLRVFREPRLGGTAAVAQLSAWALQWLSCYVLLAALGLDGIAGVGAAAAVLFAVNVTAVLPATPSNLGVFQAACVAVLGAYGVRAADAFAYGVILQAVEIATAVVMGAPALVKEGLSWRDVRMRAMHATPVELPPLHATPSRRAADAGSQA